MQHCDELYLLPKEKLLFWQLENSLLTKEKSNFWEGEAAKHFYVAIKAGVKVMFLFKSNLIVSFPISNNVKCSRVLIKQLVRLFSYLTK